MQFRQQNQGLGKLIEGDILFYILNNKNYNSMYITLVKRKYNVCTRASWSQFMRMAPWCCEAEERDKKSYKVAFNVI